MLRPLILALLLLAFQAQPTRIGIFDGSSDIGTTRPGEARFAATTGTYTVTGGGENMWFASDNFRFVWKRVTGDASIQSDLAILGKTGNPHRKAGLMIRQSLDPDSAYVDAVIHGDGLTSLQCREEKGGPTREIQSRAQSPSRLRLEKIGDYAAFFFSAPDGSMQPAGGSFRIKLTQPYYIGLLVCSHDAAAIETAEFRNVEIQEKPLPLVQSTLETISIASRDRKVIHTATAHFEAPNWSPDGKYFLFNQGGRLYKLATTGGEPQLLDTGFANRCNNDHGISPDGSLIALSDQSQDQRRSLIYIVPSAGGEPRRITQLAPSYWHGWSPDGKTLAYCAERGGNFDIYTISVNGGDEKRLTSAAGLDDGPDYSPDGRYIYFNSERSGLMQIWRMNTDGTDQTQLTDDGFNNWFAHPSPDGKWLAFVSFEKEVKGHPPNRDVWIRIMPSKGGPIQTLAHLFGGQGTMNVPSWSPDSKSLAFVSYRLIPQ